MGGQNTKVTHYNQQQNSNNNNQGHKGQTSQQFILKHIKDSFRNCSINGNLTKTQFNQSLAVLQSLNFKRLRDSPLADRLFSLFDKGKNNLIKEQDFSQGIKQIMSSKISSIQYTFRAFDRDGDNKISRQQFSQMIIQSWITAFRLLSGQIDQSMRISTRDIQQWSQSKLNLVSEQATKIFNKYDINKKGFLEFQTFKELVLNCNMNQILAEIGNKVIIVPLTLVELQRN